MSENEIIYQALVEYEENYWQSYGQEWQQKVNHLIDIYREKVNQCKGKQKTTS